MAELTEAELAQRSTKIGKPLSVKLKYYIDNIGTEFSAAEYIQLYMANDTFMKILAEKDDVGQFLVNIDIDEIIDCATDVCEQIKENKKPDSDEISITISSERSKLLGSMIVTCLEYLLKRGDF